MRRSPTITINLILFCVAALVVTGFSAQNGKAFELAGTSTFGTTFTQTYKLGHEQQPVQSVRWNPVNAKLAVAYQNYSNIEIFDGDKGKLETTLDIDAQVHGIGASTLAWSPDGSKIAAAFETQIFIWTLTSNSYDTSAIKNEGFSPSIVWSPDSQRLAEVSGSDENRKVVTWTVLNNRQIASFKSQREHEFIWEIAWSPDGKIIAASTTKGNIQFWDGETFKLLKTVNGDKFALFLQSPLAWSPDSKMLSGTECTVGQCHLWLLDVSTDTVSSPFSSALVPGPTNSIAWSPNGKFIAANNGMKDVQIFDVVYGNELQILSGHTDIVMSVSWNSDGSKIATGSLDGTVLIWKQ